MKGESNLKPGEMVQIWDYQADTMHWSAISGHGQIGYLVQRVACAGKKTLNGPTPTSGSIWEVICFGDGAPMKHKVHECWLNPIEKSSDIKKVKDE